MRTVKEYFAECENVLEYEKLYIRRCSFSLRRGGIHTMEELIGKDEDALLKIRGIGIKSIGLIREICRKYKGGE